MNTDVTMWSVLPHTHMRGKKWEVTAIYPDGRSELILDVPKYDFNWQTDYIFKEPLLLPKGTKLQTSAWYDNSTANKANPDPTKDVYWGDQTWEEMQFTAFTFSLAGAAGDDHSARRREVDETVDSGGGHARWRRPLRRPLQQATGADVHQGRRADPLQELHELSSARRDRADVAAHLQGRASVGEVDRARRSAKGTMPPWHADPAHGEFLNDRRLSAAEKDDASSQWANAGAPEGDPDGPARRRRNTPTAGRSASPTPCSTMQEDYPIPAERHDRVSVLRGPDQLHRRQVDPGDRSAAGQSAPSSTT